MDSANSNTTSTDLPSWMGMSLGVFQQSPATLGLTSLLATFFTFLAYLSYTPRVDGRSPAFTSDAMPFIGSWNFYARRWSFWKSSVENSKTGNFSFWLGKNHVVGVSGEAARKVFLDNSHLNRVSAAPLHGVGPEIVPPIHDIWKPTFHKGHSYFQRRVLDLMKSEELAKRLPRVVQDARSTFETLATSKSRSGVMNPIDMCYRLVLAQSSRIVCTDEISDSPELMDTYLYYTSILQHTSSGHTVAVPWMPSLSHMKRRYCRYGLKCLVAPIVNKRMIKGAPRGDDPLQNLIDNGDSADYIITFFINVLFISVGNAGKLAGALLNIMANHTDWQERIYGEIKAAAKAHSTKKDAALVDQLASIPLEAWESSFPSIDLWFAEAVRMHVAFPMIRQNLGPKPIPIPGSNEVIPCGSFVAYNTGDAHFNEELYPNARELDPERFREGRQEFKKETYSYLGWGNGRHRCVGQRWAKMQQNIILAHALAMFKWSTCDANGEPIPASDRKTDFDKHGNKLPQGIHIKHVPR